MVPWRWGLTGPRGIALPPAARPGPLHEAPRWGPPPRRAPRPWPPGARPGRRRRRAAASPAPSSCGPRASGAAGGGRGAPIGARASAGAAVWTLKGPGRLRAGGGRGHAWCAPSPCSPPCCRLPSTPQPLLQPPARPHCSYPSRWTPAPPSRAEPPFCREVRPGVKHRCPPVAPRRGSCREIRKLRAPGPGSDQKRLPPASLSDPTLIPLNPAPQPRSPPPPSCLGCSDLGVSTLSAGVSPGLVGKPDSTPLKLERTAQVVAPPHTPTTNTQLEEKELPKEMRCLHWLGQQKDETCTDSDLD
ncbi:formin-like protein 14 isoform X1 [Papio anubis]|uniref:formin-like protein 14 isoform X1 n=1 Tax=Papio anubis TaxID=9555 RepID=UPI0012AE4A45|nr:formin-like protein 14 isoform X1 [Papio anubis]